MLVARWRPLDVDFAAAETRRSVENNCLSQHLQALGFLAGQWHRRACADTRWEVTYPSCSNYESLDTGAFLRHLAILKHSQNDSVALREKASR